MFDIAFSELVVVGLIALIVLGPKRLPEMARAAGRWIARIRRFVEDVKRDVGAELRHEELAELRQVQQQITETKQIFESTAGSAMTGIGEIRPPETAPDYLVKTAPDSASPRRALKGARKRPSAPNSEKTSTHKKNVRTRRKPKS